MAVNVHSALQAQFVAAIAEFTFKPLDFGFGVKVGIAAVEVGVGNDHWLFNAPFFWKM